MLRSTLRLAYGDLRPNDNLEPSSPQNARLTATCGVTDELVFLPATENAAPAMIPAFPDQLYSMAGAMMVLLLTTSPVRTTKFARVEPANANPRP